MRESKRKGLTPFSSKYYSLILEAECLPSMLWKSTARSSLGRFWWAIQVVQAEQLIRVHQSLNLDRRKNSRDGRHCSFRPWITSAEKEKRTVHSINVTASCCSPSHQCIAALLLSFPPSNLGTKRRMNSIISTLASTTCLCELGTLAQPC